MLAIDWKDINFQDGCVDITKASQYVSGKGVFTKGTKNESSKRFIKLPPVVIELLLKYKEHIFKEMKNAGVDYTDSSRLFVNVDGQPMHPDTITKWFTKFIRKNNLPYITLHGLRHTSLTLLIASGLDIKTICDFSRHAQASTLIE